MKTYILYLCFFVLFFVQTSEQAKSQDIDFEYVKNTIETAVDSLQPERLVSLNAKLKQYKNVSDPEVRKYAFYYLGYSYYRLNVAFGDLSEDQREKYLDRAIKWLKKATEEDKQFAEAYSLLGSCYGKKATGVFSGMKYGPKSDAAMKKALEFAPENPRVVLLDAIGTLFKPSMFGGSTEGAIEGFKKAAEFFKTWETPTPFAPEWGHAEVYAWLGQAYRKAEKYELAQKAYQQALEEKPNYPWVKEGLLPKLNKQTD